MQAKRWAVLMTVATCWSWTAAAAAESGCPEAREAWTAGDAATAELLAEACLVEQPDDADVWFTLSRALAAQERNKEALDWADRALGRYPDDGDWKVWKTRLLVRLGRMLEAEALAAALSPEALRDEDNARLVLNLAFWTERWSVVEQRATGFLIQWPDDRDALRKRAIAYEKLAEVEAARADWTRLCALGEPEGCDAADAVAARRARYSLLIQPGYTWIEDRNNGFSGRAAFTANVWRTLVLGASADARVRDYGAGRLYDTYLEGDAVYAWTNGWMLRGALGGTPWPDFSPMLAAQIEPGYRFDNGLELWLRYWRIQFEDSGSNVVSPGLIYSWGPLGFFLRYYFTVDDDGQTGHSAIARMDYTPIRWLSLRLGGGGGNRAEYLEPRGNQKERHWTVAPGLTVHVAWDHHLSFDYVLRDELTGGQHYRQHEFLLGYLVKF